MYIELFQIEGCEHTDLAKLSSLTAQVLECCSVWSDENDRWLDDEAMSVITHGLDITTRSTLNIPNQETFYLFTF